MPKLDAHDGQAPPRMSTAARAEAMEVEDVIRHASEGRLRMPSFQRAFRWDAKDRRALIDSIYRGYPVGTLLLWKNPPPATETGRPLGMKGIASPQGDRYLMVLSGNADAHLKNWSLLYPDGVRPRLAPVYDVVSTVVYPSHVTHSALRWWEPLEPTSDAPMQLVDVTLDDLLEVASLSSADTSEVMDDLEAFVRDARAAWPDIAAAAPPVVRDRVTAHLAACSLP